MRDLRPRPARAVSLVLSAACLISCRPKDDDPPELPPPDSMTFYELKEGARSEESQGQALTAGTPLADIPGGDRSNVKTAVAALGLVTLGVHAALALPRAFIFGVVSTKPTQEGDTWIWQRRFPLIGWDATLRATAPGRLMTEMRVTGLNPDNKQHQNFLWYTGDHGIKDGKWTVYALEQTGPVLTIDWKRQAADDKEVTFTNVTTGQPASGDRLGYTLAGKVASMTIHDERDANGQPAEFSVVWHIVNGSGKMTAKSETYCWDTLEKGQLNMPCPAGAWPMP
jgi:hypothetical protein